jgi:hypothetical protein
VANECASIGLVKTDSPEKNMELFNAVLHAVKQFVHDNPEMLEGTGDFVVVFGPSARIMVVDARPN